MEWSWLQSLLFGAISGFSEFLPVSADAHQMLFSLLTGSGEELLGFRLLCHIGAFAALLLSCKPQISRLLRERRIASTPMKRRKRQPDRNTLLDIRVLTTISVPMLLAFAFYIPASDLGSRLWLIGLLIAANGVLLFLPQFFRSGNKDSQMMSAMDSVLVGLGGALAILPGLSRMGGLISVGRLRGCDSRYAVDISLLACIPALLVLIGFDIYYLFVIGAAFALKWFFGYILVAAAAFAGAYFGILLMRFLAVRVGFSGFAYYCWGAGLLIFILFLTI